MSAKDIKALTAEELTDHVAEMRRLHEEWIESTAASNYSFEMFLLIQVRRACQRSERLWDALREISYIAQPPSRYQDGWVLVREVLSSVRGEQPC